MDEAEEVPAWRMDSSNRRTWLVAYNSRLLLSFLALLGLFLCLARVERKKAMKSFA